MVLFHNLLYLKLPWLFCCFKPNLTFIVTAWEGDKARQCERKEVTKKENASVFLAAETRTDGKSGWEWGVEEWRGEVRRGLQTLEETLEEIEGFLSGIRFLRGREGDSRRLVFQLEGGSLGRQPTRLRSWVRNFLWKFSTKLQTKQIYWQFTEVFPLSEPSVCC